MPCWRVEKPGTLGQHRQRIRSVPLEARDREGGIGSSHSEGPGSRRRCPLCPPGRCSHRLSTVEFRVHHLPGPVARELGAKKTRTKATAREEAGGRVEIDTGLAEDRWP